jgi:hypothetical protein
MVLGKIVVSSIILSLMLVSPTHALEFERARGIYLLGNLGQRQLPADVIELPHVDGYTMRLLWEEVEALEGKYDFSAISTVLGQLAPFGSRKRLTLELFAREVPQYILQHPGVKTYSITPRNASAPDTTAVPWDEYALARYEALMQALAAYPVFDPAIGDMTPLRDHSLLAHVDAQIVGLGSVRDIPRDLPNAPGYSRDLFVPAGVASVGKTIAAFPGKFPFLAFFQMSDNIAQPPLDRVLLEQLRTAYFPGGNVKPQLGLFQENLACATPNTAFAYALAESQADTYILFQALQPWLAPFSNPSRTDVCLVFDPPLPEGWQTGDPATDNAIRATAIGGPEIGLRHAINNFSCFYFELYLQDLRHVPFRDEFMTIHDLIWETTTGTSAMTGLIIH